MSARLTYGSRFEGGYQFPRTDSVRLTRGDPIRVERVTGGGSIEVVPLRGGRRRIFEITATYELPGRVTVQSSTFCYDELEVAVELRRLIAAIALERAA